MRLLGTNKPIPVAYLKSGKDNGSYDLEKLIWLPGRTTPIRVPDLNLAGKQRMGVASPMAAPPPAPPKERKGTGLLIPVHRPRKVEPLVIASR